MRYSAVLASWRLLHSHNFENMRVGFEQQGDLFYHSIETAVIPIKSRDHLVSLVASLKALYINSSLRDQIIAVMQSHIPFKMNTGRKGLNLWQIFVLAQCRLCLDISYDRLHHIANHDRLLRHILGIRELGTAGLTQWNYQRIYDNVTILTDDSVKALNGIIVEMGHEVFNKKGEEPLRLKTDSFVVESNVHFPTDYNLLWDSSRKSLDTIGKILKKHPDIPEWRKLNDWKKVIKNLSRALGQASSGGGKNKEERVKNATEKYLQKGRKLVLKIEKLEDTIEPVDLTDILQMVMLHDYKVLIIKHIDLVDRRLLQGEKIPHEEKLFSIFEQYTEWVAKGKSRPNVELGKKVSITTDQYHLIVDYKIMESESDSQIVKDTGARLSLKYKIASWSFDKGYWHKENKAYLSKFVDQVIMPKKGKCNEAEREIEHSKEFKGLRNKHSAVESNINELEHRGLDRCPDRGYKNYKKYIGLGVCAYNLHKIGKELLRQRAVEEKRISRCKAA